jgi:hypothetical protein
MARATRALPVVAIVSYATAVHPQQPPPAERVVPAFTIAKSENKNQVQYVIRLDERCIPVGPTPMSAFWRMLEAGPTHTAPILPREVRAYGLESQVVVATGPSGGQVRAVLKALPGRPVTIETSRGGDGQCRALSTAVIAGAPAHLFNVYVHLKWDGVDYLLLQGWSMDGSRVVRETITK